jgi:WD40 repeat protein
MAVGGNQGTYDAGVIQLWDTKTWLHIKTLSFTGSEPFSLAFSPDSRRLAAAHEDNVVRVWDIATGTLRTLSGHKKFVTDVVFSPDGRLIASASQDMTIRIWDGETYELRATLLHERPVLGLAFHPRGRLLASATGSGVDISGGISPCGTWTQRGWSERDRPWPP